jgi:hypothetical protein
MNENAKAWVAALRSGDYKQGREVLRDGDEFCCLGVACDLAVKAGLPIDVHNEYAVASYNENTGTLPNIVRRWLGLTTDTGGYWDKAIGSGSLAALNDDRGYDFEQIADVIEQEPDGLFTGS